MVGFDQEYKYKNLPKSNHPESMAITKLTTVKALYCKEAHIAYYSTKLKEI